MDENLIEKPKFSQFTYYLLYIMSDYGGDNDEPYLPQCLPS